MRFSKSIAILSTTAVLSAGLAAPAFAASNTMNEDGTCTINTNTTELEKLINKRSTDLFVSKKKEEVELVTAAVKEAGTEDSEAFKEYSADAEDIIKILPTQDYISVIPKDEAEFALEHSSFSTEEEMKENAQAEFAAIEAFDQSLKGKAAKEAVEKNKLAVKEALAKGAPEVTLFGVESTPVRDANGNFVPTTTSDPDGETIWDEESSNFLVDPATGEQLRFKHQSTVVADEFPTETESAVIDAAEMEAYLNQFALEAEFFEAAIADYGWSRMFAFFKAQDDAYRACAEGKNFSSPEIDLSEEEKPGDEEKPGEDPGTKPGEDTPKPDADKGSSGEDNTLAIALGVTIPLVLIGLIAALPFVKQLLPASIAALIP